MHRDRAELAPADVFAKFPGRKEELLGLMKDLEINFANGTGSDWGIRMVFEATGMAMGGTTKSFSFSDTPPKRIVPSTDHFKPDTADSSSVFRSIAPSWYLRFDWGG
ncbi:MAG TPA: hypothetical protein VD994_10520 [Prosthecobacter sp.]|nr:hypothetical protein [Prosthecobacter sp.]